MYASFLRIFLSIGILPVVLLAAANYLIDPYQVFQTGLLPEVGQTEERYLKIEYLKHNPRLDTFLLGGSRAGTANPADIEKVLAGAHVYNFFVSSGNQSDNLMHGRWLLDHMPRVKVIYVQVDWPESIGAIQGGYQYIHHPEVSGKSAAGFQIQYLMHFSYNAFEYKIQNNTNHRGDFKLPLESGQFYYPRRDALITRDCPAYVRQSPSLTDPVGEAPALPHQKMLIDESLDTLRQLVAAAANKGVRIELYVTPHHHRFLDKINLDQYKYFLSKLATIAPFWNFGFYSDITLNDCNYYESSHYLREVAPRLYTAMNNGSPASYVHHVTPNGIADELTSIEANFRKYRNAPSSKQQN